MVLVFFFNHVTMCLPQNQLQKTLPRGRDKAQGRGHLPAQVGTGKERLLGERQCQTARRTFEVATAKGTPSLVETHPA